LKLNCPLVVAGTGLVAVRWPDQKPVPVSPPEEATLPVRLPTSTTLGAID